MQEKDKIKGIVALITFSCIAISYFLFGKDIAKYIAIAGFVVWLGAMYFLNKRD